MDAARTTDPRERERAARRVLDAAIDRAASETPARETAHRIEAERALGELIDARRLVLAAERRAALRR